MGGPGFVAPSDRLVIAGIGVGGKGESDIYSFAQTGKADIGFYVMLMREGQPNLLHVFLKQNIIRILEK